jgi:hypothetical protein
VKHDRNFFTLTEAGLQIINQERGRQGLDALPMVHYSPPTEEERAVMEEERAEREATHRYWGLRVAKEAAGLLDREGLTQLRQWIDDQLGEKKSQANG